MEACATINNIFMGATIMGGMILGYFRWFYSKNRDGSERPSVLMSRTTHRDGQDARS